MRIKTRNCTRRDFLRALGLGASALAVSGCAGLPKASAPRRSRPNIIFVLADDLGYGDLTCLNKDSRIPTPRMDRLAEEGVHFTDAHTPSAVCTPTRYGVLTGRYCWRSRLRTGVLGGYSEPLIEKERLTVASFLKQRGYRTGCVGKWHLGLGWGLKDPGAKPGADNIDYARPTTHNPNTLGFDYSCVIPASLDMAPYCWLENGSVVEPPTDRTPGSKRRWSGGGGFWRAGPIAPSFDFEQVLPTIAEKSVQFIGRQTAQTPFFLYVAFNAPHTPWMPTKEFRGRTQIGFYGDFVSQVDWTVGQIVDAVGRAGVADNTLIIVTSDNGSHWPVEQIEKHNHRANYHFRGQKADIHEGGHRVPFVCRWPGKIKPAALSSQTICLTDLLGTCAGILGEQLPDDAGQDSYNILPAMLNPDLDKPIREATVHHSAAGMFSIRQGPWKLILGRGSGGFTAPRRIKPEPGEPEGQLYNLDEDVSEKNNLWAQHPQIVARLTALLERYRRQGYTRAPRPVR